ncbi:hypothetical protein HA48_14755 [Pantoea wallisii]|uniref:Uncharacterized protein n=1 Tax=Pantoea wallisii TaxID=1076551 RepID=A0A1X1D7C3_9GAMM|nr:hypothetical protein [Pantoea wallisii]ORM72411.1 hypothetical protein HA48_14755 [Pantoea wallisii]
MISDERLEKISEDDHVQCGDASAMAKELLALRKAFSAPFCFTDDAGVALRSHHSNFECSPVKFGNKDIPLYRKTEQPC